MSYYDDCATILVRRRGAWMAEAGLSTATTNNPDVADPIAWAIRRLGVEPANYLSPTDSEIVAAGGVPAVADLAEYRLLLTIRGNIAKVDATAGPLSEKFSQLLNAIEQELSRLERSLPQVAGNTDVANVDVGAFYLDFAEKDEE